MREESNKHNGVEHVPTCSTWPPPWLTSPPPPPSTAPGAGDARLKAVEPMPASPVVPELPADLLTELQREVDSMLDIAWENAWTERLRPARDANLDSVRRTTRLMLDLAAERHRAGDAAEFGSWCRYIIRHVRGELWDDTARRPPVRSEDFEIGT